MKRWIVFLGILLTVVFLAPVAEVRAGSAAQCEVSPEHGPPGTDFAFHCSGFSPNTIVNVWVVDPSGVAETGPTAPGAPADVKTDESGHAAFVWTSPGGTNHPIYFGTPVYQAAEFGHWTWYVNELCSGKPCIVGSATVHIDSVAEDIRGAELHVSPSYHYAGYTGFKVTGSGFTPLQVVTVWTSSPAMCDTSTFLFAVSATWVRDVKADEAGNIATTVDFTPGDCLGEYGVTAREVVSQRGAITTLRLTGTPVTPTFGDSDTLTVSPNTIDAAAGVFQTVATVSGSGFQALEVVSCWVTRPDNAVAQGYARYGFDTRANASGQIAATMIGSDLSSAMGGNPFGTWSAISGTHRITCRGNASGVTQLGSFRVVGETFDP